MRFSPRFFVSVALFLLLMLGLLIGVLTFQKRSSRFAIRTDQAAVVKQIQSLSRYETTVFTIEKIIEAGTAGNRFQELLFGDRILLIAHGQVVAGFDLAQLTDQDVAVQNNRITLNLPAPQILLTRLDNEQTRVYDRQQGLLTKGETDLESSARQAAEETIRQAACDSGILDQAAASAQDQLGALLRSAGYEVVEIIIPKGECQ